MRARKAWRVWQAWQAQRRILAEPLFPQPEVEGKAQVEVEGSRGVRISGVWDDYDKGELLAQLREALKEVNGGDTDDR